MKKKLLIILAAFLVLTVAPFFAAAVFGQDPTPALEAGTGIVIQVPGLELGWIDAALGLFGIGLVYLINFIKKIFGWEAKKAVLLTIGVSIAAAAITLLVKGAFTVPALILYSAAVLGELTGWFKLTKKPAA